MKKIIVALLLVSLSYSSKAQDSLNMNLHFNWVDTAGLYYNTYFGINHYFNEIWGWHNDSTGAEYAIMGAADGTYFFDVTNLDSCYLVDYIEAKDRAEIHRDYKSYKNYIYMVADEGNNSLQIFDMSTLPDSITLVYDSNEFVTRSHNIFIDEGILYIVTPSSPISDPSGFRMLDLTQNPSKPTLIADYNLPFGHGNHVHDMFVRNHKAYCSNGNAGFHIYDVEDPSNISPLASIEAYTEQGYNHNSWMSEDCSTIFFTDETLGMGIKSYNITDLDDITLNTIFRSNEGAMAHNVLVHGNMLYVSYYHDGIVVFDITDPANPILVASYDTFEEQNGYDNYQGAWGVYPFLPSGTILGSDFENGLFVLTMDSSITPVYNPIECKDTVINTTSISEEISELKISPNPANTFINLNNNKSGKLEVLDIVGKIVLKTSIHKNEPVNISNLEKGIYFVRFSDGKRTVSTKFIKE